MSSQPLRCPKCDRILESRDRVGGDDANPQFKTGEVVCPSCGTVSNLGSLDPTVLYSKQPEEPRLTRVGHFTLIRTLGQGAAGEVWLAEDINLGRQVALKLPRSPDQQTMSLLFEAKTAASLRHPHIVSVYEVGLEGAQVFIASEFIDGLTLRDFLTAGKPPVDRAVDLLARIARALDYAHQRGVVHRDVKPANILLDKAGQPFVADFGLAKRLDAEASISSEGQIVGTIRYMSPEQASGKTRETDARSDLYALGVMMFEMLTGDSPFRGNARAILDQKINLEPPSPRTLIPSLPKDLETICLKCLEREPNKRFASAAEFADELDRFVAGEPIHARPISRLERTWRWCRMRPVVSGLLAGLFLSLSGGLLGVSFFWREAATSAEVARKSLYRSQMNLAAVHLGHGDIAGVRGLLDRVSADPQVSRFRGFEWNYFDQLLVPLTLVANHGEPVTDVAISRDGDVCASIGSDRLIRVWDARTRELVRSLTVSETIVFQSIEFSPITMHLASGSSDGFVRVWNPLQDGRVMQQMQHGPPVILVRFSPNGKRLLTAGKKGAVRLWDAANGMLVAELPTGKREPTKDARFSVDSKQVTIGSEDGHLRVWNLDTFKDSPRPESEWDTSPPLESLAVSDDGRFVATGTYHGQLGIRDAEESEQFVEKSIWGRIDDVEFLAGSSLLAVVSSDGKLHLFDVDQWETVRDLNTHGFTAGSLARSADGKSLAVGSGDGSVTLVRLDGLKKRSILWHEGPVRNIEMLPSGTELIATSDAGDLRFWNLETGESHPFSVEDTHSPKAITRQPHGKLLASAGKEPVVVLWDIDKRSRVRELPAPPTGALAVKFSPTGRFLAVATRRGPVQIYAADNWDHAPTEMTASGKVQRLAISPDDKWLAIAVENGGVELFDVTSGASRVSIPMKSDPSALAFCDNGRLLAIGTNVGEIHFWEVASRRIRFVIKGHTARINALAELPNNQTLVSGGRDRQLKLWDIPTGDLLAPLTGHLRQIFAIAVSPDGKTIASGGLEGDIRIWTSVRK